MSNRSFLGALAAAIALAALAAAPANPAPVAARAATVCTRHVAVTFAVYSYMPLPTSNGCWSFERVVQAHWRICHWDKAATGSTRSTKFAYDDTSPAHLPLSAEDAKIRNCGAGRTYGYEFMARRNGAWRKRNPNGVIDRYFAEVYSSEGRVWDLLGAWKARPVIGRPMINVGPASNAAAQYAAFKLCRSVASGKYIGIYSGSEVSGRNGKLGAIQKGLNQCTTG